VNVPNQRRAPTIAADFFVEPTATCRLLFGFVLLAHSEA
jgi:hypothetical protein